MNSNRKYRSQLFTLRLWIEPGVPHRDGERGEIRFKVQHLPSGEVRYFREWEEVAAFINEQSASQEDDSQEMEERE